MTVSVVGSPPGRRSADLERELAAFATHLIERAKDKDTKLEDAVKVFKEVRELYGILTKEPEAGDKPQGRRSTTISGMRKRIAAARGESNGRAEPPIPDAGGRA